MTSTLSPSQQDQSLTRPDASVSGQPDALPQNNIVWTIPCEWRGCNAQQITLDGLLEHMYTIHVQDAKIVNGGKARYECRWTHCDRERRKFHSGLSSKRALMAHLRKVFERDPRWECGECDECAVVRATDLIEHHKIVHEDPFVKSLDRGTKAASRKGGTHEPPSSGVTPMLPRYSTVDGKLFTGWRNPIDLTALAPKSKSSRSPPDEPQSSIGDDDEEEMREDSSSQRGTKRKLWQSSDDSEANTEDRQVGSVDFNANLSRPATDPSPGRWQSANTQVEVDMVNNIAASPVARTQVSESYRYRRERMSTSPRPHSRDQPAEAQPPPQRSTAPDYRAAYLIEKAKYRFVVQTQDRLRDELEQLRAEYEDAYTLKENALDQVLRAKFGSTADVLTHPPSR